MKKYSSDYLEIIKKGVPEGWILGLLLYIFYTKKTIHFGHKISLLLRVTAYNIEKIIKNNNNIEKKPKGLWFCLITMNVLMTEYSRVDYNK